MKIALDYTLQKRQKLLRVNLPTWLFRDAVMLGCSSRSAHFMFSDGSEAYMTCEQLKETMKGNAAKDFIRHLELPKAFVDSAKD